ncbi:MAG TPA: hypothetical protein VFH17_08460 [Coriobacteriia bacterium]|nr:hypothetical protein [Coriobacteriia bacterium]
MADIARDFPDTLLDSIVAALSAFSLSQTAAVRFNAERDRSRPLDRGDLPHVNVWTPDERPEDGRSARQVHAALVVTVNVDCVTGMEAGDTDESDVAAATRLHYLRAQVRHAIYKLANADFGYAAGVIASKSWPRWQQFPVDGDAKHEEQIIGGLLSFDVEYAWQPQDIDHDPLTSVRVSDDTADMWAAYFDTLPGGDT